MQNENTQVSNPFSHGLPVAAAPQGAMAAAASQREVAEVQAAVVMAKRFPRDPIKAMDRILQNCTRPKLAEVAIYQFSRGGTDINGPSIRLLEEVCRGWGNVICGITELSRQDGASECLAFAWDLETNFRDEKKFQVKHWRDTRNGGYKLTDERDIYELIANMGARRKRACMETIIPGDVLEAAREQCEVTLKTTIEITEESIKAVVEQFAKFGVTKEQIEKRIQRRIDTLTPALWLNLKRIYTSLKEGMSTPEEWFEVAEVAGDESAKTATTGNAGAKDALRKRPGSVKPTEKGDQAAAASGVRGAPTIHEALSMVNRGFYDDARDMAKAAPFTENDRAEIESAIGKHKLGQKV